MDQDTDNPTPAPDASQLPVTSQAPPPSPTTAQPPAGAPNPVDQNHNFLGRAVRHVASALEGKQVSYQPDPETGDIKEVVQPRKPGGIFRDILLGSLIGGAAAQSNPNRESILGGAATGGAAEHQFQQADDSRAKVRAQDSAQLQKQAADQQQAKQDQSDVAAATVAKSTMSTLDFDHHANLHNPDQIKAHNLSSDVLMDTLKKNGGTTPNIVGPDGKDLNSTPDNGGKLLELFNKDPQSVMQAPEGYHRVPITQVDTNGLKHDGNQWLGPDGKPVDLSDRTTFHLVDIPNTSWNKNVVLPRSAVNDVAGAQIAQGDGKGTVSTTLGGVFGLHLKNIDQMNSARRDLYASPKDDNEAAAMAGRIGQINSDPNASDDDKKWASTKQTILDSRQKARNAQLLQEQAAKTEGKTTDYPTFKSPEEAAGYQQNAQRVLSDPKSTPEQKQQAQTQIKYANDSVKTLIQTAARLSGAKKSAEVNAENASIDKSAVGAKDLPSALQSRFNALPDTVKGQLNGIRTRDIASVFALADGDTSKSTFPSRIYKGSNQLTQSDAFGLAKQLNPNLDEKLYNSKQKLLNDYTSSKGTGGQIETFNNFLNHAADASDVANHWRDTGSPFLNTAMNKLRNQAEGDPQYTQLVAALEPVRKEYMSFLNANRAEHTQDLEVMQKILSDDATPAQMQEGFKQLANTGVLRLDSINQNWKTVTGGNYPNLITPKAKQAAAKLGQGKAIAEYGSGGQLSAESTRQTPPPSPPAGASAEVYSGDGKTLLGHAVNGKFVPLGK